MTERPRPPVIVTRAEPGAGDTAKRLGEAGWRAVVSPALQIEWLFHEGAGHDAFSGISGVILTSANGVRAFMRTGAPAETLTAWCVGPATTDAASALPFVKVHNADGNADDLVAYIRAHAGADDRLLHIANDAAAGQVVQRLNEAGMQAEFLALYTTQPASALTEAAKVALEERAVVMIHSAKGAAAFAAAARDLNLGRVFAVAVSEAAAAPLQPLHLAGTLIAERPNEDALMAALSRLDFAL